MKLLAAMLGAVLIVLTPLVHSSPIDPSTPGFWDDGDFDDVIVFLSSHLHLIEHEDVRALPPSDTVLWEVLEHPPGALVHRSHQAGVPRAPPAA